MIMKKWIMNWLLSDQNMRDYVFTYCGWKSEFISKSEEILKLRKELNSAKCLKTEPATTPVVENKPAEPQKKKRKYTKRKKNQD